MSESTLLQNLRTYFSEGDLRDLCFELGIDYESVPDQTKYEMARELILYCERRGRLTELVQLCRRERPQAAWDDVPADTSVHAPLTQSAPTGLGALVQLMQVPGVRAAAGKFQGIFRTACDQIKALSHYKRLHDLFQELETAYDLLEPDRRVLANEPAAWDRLLLNEPAVSDAIQELLACVEQSPITHERPMWAQQLGQMQGTLRVIVASIDSGALAGEQLVAAAGQVGRLLDMLNRILDRTPSNINNLLVDRANALHLSELLAAMASVRDSVVTFGQDLVAVRQFDTGLQELMRQRDSLAEQVRDHSLWQEIDDELRRVKQNLGSDLFELEQAWPDLNIRAHALCAASSASWAVGIVQTGAQLEDALMMAVKTPDRIKRYFYNYRRKATQRFRQVDDQLLRLCDDLQGTGEKLDAIIQALQ